MSNNTASARRTTPHAGNTPQPGTKRQYRVMNPVRREGQEKPFWSRIGTAWENEAKDGKAPTISLRIDQLPMNGEIVLFEDDGEERESRG